MKQLFLNSIGFFVCFFPMFAQAQQQGNFVQGKTIQIVLDKDSKSNAIPMLVDTRGNKMPLTLGTFENATAESWMEGMQTAQAIPVDPNAIAFIEFKKEGNNIKAYLMNYQGKAEGLNLGNLLTSAAVSYPGCTADQIDGRTINLRLDFKKDSNGTLQCYLNGPKADEVFNFGVLIREVTTLLNNCQ